MSVLAVYFTLHMIGVVIWLGAALLLPIVVIPAVRSLEEAGQVRFMEVFTKRYLPWFVIAGVAVGLTGLGQTLQMMDELNIPTAIAKHVAILPLIVVSAYMWFYLARRLSRPMADRKGIWIQFTVLAWIQAALGVVVLLLTGWLTG